jgi:hypothetical protein
VGSLEVLPEIAQAVGDSPCPLLLHPASY